MVSRAFGCLWEVDDSLMIVMKLHEHCLRCAWIGDPDFLLLFVDLL